MSMIDEILRDLVSPDALTRENAASQAIAIGGAAARPLERLIERMEANTRASAMYALSEIADRDSASTFVRYVNDPDPRVRSHAASGLARLQHPLALEAAIATLNDDADPLHNDVTPSVLVLADFGMAAVPALLTAMAADDELTRLRAQRAFERIVMRRHGFVEAQGFSSPPAEDLFRRLWAEKGSYAYDADQKSRTTSLEMWRQWHRQVIGSS